MDQVPFTSTFTSLPFPKESLGAVLLLSAPSGLGGTVVTQAEWCEGYQPFVCLFSHS